VGSHLIQAGFLSRAALEALYDSVDAVVYPSLYEGFGLPVVEAQASGKPLLLSDIPVLREVSGGRARFFEPRDPGSLERELSGLLHDLGQPGGLSVPVHEPRGWGAYMDDLLLEMDVARNGSGA
jgi:glycosyltransferase involved in cell wall biosynthesis